MKTIRKYLVNAFTKVAKERGWEDSSKHPRGLRACGFKSARQWGRAMADNYFYPGNLHGMDSVVVEMIEQAALNDEPLTQHDFDALAEEEISCW